MRRISALLSVAAVVMWTVGAYAQAKPDFSGKWVREAPAGGAAAGGGGGGGGRGGGGGGFGMENTITQNAKTLTIVTNILDSDLNGPSRRRQTATSSA